MKKILFMIAMVLCVQAGFAAQQMVSENADGQKDEMSVASEKPVCRIWLLADTDGYWHIRASYPLPYGLDVMVNMGIYNIHPGTQDKNTFLETDRYMLEIVELGCYSDDKYTYAIGWAP